MESGRKRFVTAAILALATAASPVRAAVVFQDLGTAAPPAALGPFPLLPFSRAAQATIPDLTNVTTIPGSPVPGTLTTNVAVTKRTVGVTWKTWSHGYDGPVFSAAGTTVTLMTPDTHAFYAYVEPNSFATFSVTVTTKGGGTSGPIPVSGLGGANGFGFYTTAGEEIMRVTITVDPAAEDFAIGEFGIERRVAVPALQPAGVVASAILLLAIAGAMHRRRFA